MQVLIEDLTPIVIGPYEDPNIADAFASDVSASTSGSEGRNTMLMHLTRNLAKIRLPVSACADL